MEKLYTCVECGERFKVVCREGKPVDRSRHEVEMNVECPYCSKTNAIVWPQYEDPRVVTEDGKPGQELSGVKIAIRSIAMELIAERIGVIGAARKLSGLRHYVEPQIAEVLMTFLAIDSETDTLPVGGDRKEWNAEALKRKDLEIEEAERMYRESAMTAAGELIRLLNG
jgi:DNA-directed RNA polymerase subunit RPC12/RpoP